MYIELLLSVMTYAAMSAATQDSCKLRRNSIMNSLVSKEIHDQGKKNIIRLEKRYVIKDFRGNIFLLGIQYCDYAASIIANICKNLD